MPEVNRRSAAGQAIGGTVIAASLLTHRRGWVAERSGEIVAFSMADKANADVILVVGVNMVADGIAKAFER